MEILLNGCHIRVDEPMISWRCGDDLNEYSRPWGEIYAHQLRAAVPWRTFRWFHGQRHYSGTYWSSTTTDFVVYESRLELSRLLLADFDDTVEHIVAQPFLMSATVDGRRRSHVPDYLLFTAGGLTVVDVKPQHRLNDPKVVFMAAWAREMIESCGWCFEFAAEPPVQVLENVRFLAGYRRSWLIDQPVLEHVRKQPLSGTTLADAFTCVPGICSTRVKPAVLHMLWRNELRTDLMRRLSGRSEIATPA